MLDKMTVIKRFFKTKIIEIQAAIYNNKNNTHNGSFLDSFLAVIFFMQHQLLHMTLCWVRPDGYS